MFLSSCGSKERLTNNDSYLWLQLIPQWEKENVIVKKKKRWLFLMKSCVLEFAWTLKNCVNR